MPVAIMIAVGIGGTAAVVSGTVMVALIHNRLEMLVGAMGICLDADLAVGAGALVGVSLVRHFDDCRGLVSESG
jgi:hypothetical protein